MVGEFKLSPEARAWGTEWYSNHWKNPPKDLTNDQFGGYLARKQTHIHKLAMVVAASRSNDLIITRDALETAETFVSALERDMPRVFARVGQTDVTKGSYDLLEILRKQRKIAQMDAYKLLFRNLSYRDFEVAVQSVINAGHARIQQEGNSLMLICTLPEEKSE